MPESDVELALRWSETGSPIPARVGSELQGIKKGAADAAQSLNWGLTGAFERFERSEPTRFLRQARFGLEALALQATSMSGPLARLGASLGLFATGSAWGIAALAGVAAIAGAYKLWRLDTEELEAAHKKLRLAIDATNLAHAGKIGAISQQLTGTGEETGFWHLLVSDREKGAGEIEQRAAAARKVVDLQERVAHQIAVGLGGGAGFDQMKKDLAEATRGWEELNRAVKDHESELTRLQGILVTVRAGGVSPESALQATIAARVKQNKAHAMALLTARGMGTGVGSIVTPDWMARQELRSAGVSEADIDDIMARQRGDEALLRSATEGAAAAAFPSPGVVRAGAPYTDIDQSLRRRGGLDEFTRRARGAGGVISIMGERAGPEAQPIGIMAAGGGTMGITARGQKELLDAAERERLRIQSLQISLIHAGVGVASSIVRRDSTGQIIGGGLQAAGGIVASLPEPHAKLAGAALEGLGAMVSLFSSKKPSVTVSAYEAQALAQMKEVRGDPQTTSVTIIGAPGDIRPILYAAARAGSRGVTVRGPG